MDSDFYDLDTGAGGGFVIDTDQKAEWALKKIAAICAEAKRYVDVCDAEISRYASKKAAAVDRCAKETGNLTAMLEAYFARVEPKATKTQATYALPSGKLKRRFERADYVVKDEARLTAALSETPYVETKLCLKWGEFKKTLRTAEDGETVVDEGGEVVEGVAVEVKPAAFTVEIDEGV